MEPTDSEFMRELMTVFCGEAEERLATVDQRLLAIEQTHQMDQRTDLLADLMRELHTLKGSAGAVNLPDVSRLAHALETHFGKLASPGTATETIFDHGYAALDSMRAMIDAGAGGVACEVDVDAVMATLSGAEPAATRAQGWHAVDDFTPAPLPEHMPILPAPEPPATPTIIDHRTVSHDVSSVVDAPSATAAHVAQFMPGHDPLPGAASATTTTIRPAEEVTLGSASAVAPAPAVVVPGVQLDASSPAHPTPAAPTIHARARRPEGADEVVRLSTAKLDSLMARVGELVVTRIGTGRRTDEIRALAETVAAWEETWRRIRPQYLKIVAAAGGESGTSLMDLIPEIQRLAPAVDEADVRSHEMSRQVTELRAGIEADERRLAQVTTDIEDEVRRTRMLPVSSTFDPLHRLVRDLARDLGKEVLLEVEGGDTEVDRSVLEHIRSPLTHLVRNALDHGVETPDVREAAGKARRATLRLAATQRGGSLILAIADDGGGIDVEHVRETAVGLGLVTNDQLRVMSERDVLRLIFRPSFSTSGSLTDVSGRGVGLDVVRETVERLNGMVDVSSELGAGTTFTLSLPLSVATTQALLIEIAGAVYALPIGAVSRIVSADRDEIGRAQGREMIVLEDGPVVLVRLEDVLQLPSDEESAASRRPIIIIGSDERRIGVAVDGLIGTQDVVVKPLPKPFERVRNVAGATVLASGEVVVVLNTSDLVRSAVRTAVRVEPALERGGETSASRMRTPHSSGAGSVMVVDDSIVTRMLEKSILEAAGYTVHVAADGVEALRALHATPVDLVVSDINMPNMDGLALTQQIRADVALRDVPIVLVTSLDAPDDQMRGMEAGADAYIVKSSFSQEGLLETVARLITTQRIPHARRTRR